MAEPPLSWWGISQYASGTIHAAIGRDRSRRNRMSTKTKEGRDAVTRYKVVKEFTTSYGKFALLDVTIETGRTHQIRVHLKAIGHPVVGDLTYGSGSVIRGIALPRQFLHASQLHFHHPITDEPLAFEAPLPVDLQSVLDQKNFL